jgi:hypothetical protein
MNKSVIVVIPSHTLTHTISYCDGRLHSSGWLYPCSVVCILPTPQTRRGLWFASKASYLSLSRVLMYQIRYGMIVAVSQSNLECIGCIGTLDIVGLHQVGNRFSQYTVPSNRFKVSIYLSINPSTNHNPQPCDWIGWLVDSDDICINGFDWECISRSLQWPSRS